MELVLVSLSFSHIFYVGTKKIAIAIAFFTFSSVVLKGPTEIFSCSSLVMQSATLLKVTLLHDCFSRFLNYTNGTKLCAKHHIYFAKGKKSDFNTQKSTKILTFRRKNTKILHFLLLKLKKLALEIFTDSYKSY